MTFLLFSSNDFAFDCSGDAKCVASRSHTQCPNCKLSCFFWITFIPMELICIVDYFRYPLLTISQARPTMYQVVQEMIEKMGYAVSLCAIS